MRIPPGDVSRFWMDVLTSSLVKIESRQTKVKRYRFFMINSTLFPPAVYSHLPKNLLFFAILGFLLSLPIYGCSSSRSTTADTASAGQHEEREHEEEEEEEGGKRKKVPTPPPAWSIAEIMIDPAEAQSDTLRFHIGSPFFLRLKVTDAAACTPFSGRIFYFDAPGAQLGWGFHEVTDTLLFPRTAGSCERIVMLSSDNSNRIAEGDYTLKLQVFLDAANRVNSDTLVLQAVRSASGADTLSYARFLQEQIVNNSPLLADPETLRALFAEGTPRSPESEIYRAIILFKSGNPSGAEEALLSSRQLQNGRRKKLDQVASASRDALVKAMASVTSSK